MGYTTDFDGKFKVEPPLNKEEVEFLTKFAGSRRMLRSKGPYFVEGRGYGGQDHEGDIIVYNTPPEGQPGLWCHWIPNPDDASEIIWDEGEKFYNATDWIAYIIDHFIGTNPIAKDALPFLQSHTINGTVTAQGEDRDDLWCIEITDNDVVEKQGTVIYT